MKSRKDTRDALVTALENQVVTADSLAKSIEGSKINKLSGSVPLVAVLSRGASHRRGDFNSDTATHRFLVQTWVQQERTGWTNAEAQDRLDAIECSIATVVEAQRATSDWLYVEYASASRVDEAVVDGDTYYVESVLVEARVQ